MKSRCGGGDADEAAPVAEAGARGLVEVSTASELTTSIN